MTEISSLDLHYLIEELKFLEDAKVDKISQPSKDEIFLQFYVKGKKKQILRLSPPKHFYIASGKPAAAEKIFGFCSALRKYLSNAILTGIVQGGSERIAKLLFRSKEGEYSLFIELFAKGNIVLCRKDLTIIVPLRQHKFKDRLVKAGVKYVCPKKQLNFFEISEKDIKKYKKEQEQTISKLLAVELGFGGKYSRELCLLSNIPLTAKSLGEKQANALFKSIKSITSKKTEPFVVYTGKGAEAVPFELEVYRDFKKERKESFNSAVEAAATSGEAKKITKSQKEAERLEKLIRIQEEKIKELEKSAEENQKKGEIVYEKYQLLSEVLDEIRKARKKYSWKEIREKLKGHKLIKEVNEKTGEIVVEV